MASVNKVILIGNLGRDPEVRYMTSGAAVCNFSIATSRRWKDKQGELQEETEWHNIVCYERTAENAEKYLSKGSPVYIEGRLKTRKWEDKEGVTKYTTEIICEQMQFLGKREDGEDERPSRSASQRQPERGRAPAPAPRPAAKKSNTGFDDMDDDIPF